MGVLGVTGVTGARRLWSAVSIRADGLQDLRWTGGDAEETTLESLGFWCLVLGNGIWMLEAQMADSDSSFVDLEDETGSGLSMVQHLLCSADA